MLRGTLGDARAQIEAADLGGDEAREVVRSQMLDFCRTHPDALHRSCVDGHLTGSALVVDPDAGWILLIHHVKLERWLQPGGHADGDGNLGAVALREANEETGLTELRLVTPAIDVDIHQIPPNGRDPAHLHLDVRFCVVAGPDRTANPNHETLGARWVPPDDPLIAAAGLTNAAARALQLAAPRTPEGSAPPPVGSGGPTDP